MPELTEVRPATGKACSKCPWRLANQGQPHPHGFYTKANLRRLWAGIRRGARMSCHPTDPRMAEFEGYEKTAGVSCTHECSGALVLVQRELQRFKDAAEAAGAAGGSSDGLQRYRREHPKGLTREGLAEHVMSMVMVLPGENAATAVDLNDTEIGFPDLTGWEQR
jgi:hypothetical protein